MISLNVNFTNGGGTIMETDNNTIICPCNNGCEYYKNCAACKEHHHSWPEKPLTACERLEIKKCNK